MARLTNDEILQLLVNKMLEKYNVNFDYVVENKEINGKPWYIHYTWTTAEEEEFRAWAISFLRKKQKWYKARSEQFVIMFLCNYGLHVTDFFDNFKENSSFAK